jgi:3-dehydroquinate synthase
VQPLTIKSAGGDYSVQFVGPMADVIAAVPSDSFVACDANITTHYKEWVDIKRRLNTVIAEEPNKDLDRVMWLCRWLQECGATKGSTVVAVGGGIVQDVATMAAHLYHRGVDLVLVPTTLLAQADSCIGSKCGINLGGTKNQLGCFKSPKLVVVCPEFFKTLDDDAIKSGYGEILKLALIGGKDRFTDLETFVYNAGLRRSAPSSVVASLTVKQRFIEADEFETKDQRLLLSYGHTFGHALEAVSNHTVPHGIAVAWGIDVANWIAHSLDLLEFDRRLMVTNFIRRYLKFDTHSSGLTAANIVTAIRRDKKAGARGVRMVLMRKPGDMVLQEIDFDELERLTDIYLETENAYDS